MGLTIACITPWGKWTKCGIRTYSEALLGALAEKDVETYVVRLPRFGQKTPEILRNVARSVPWDKIDILLCEHEYGLYQNLDGGFFDNLAHGGKPLITTMHGVGFQTDTYIASKSDRIIVHNQHCAQMLRRRGIKNVTIIPHGVATRESIPMAEAKQSYGIPPDVPVVGYLGFISEVKGLEDLIVAMTRVPNAALLVAGGWFMGPETSYITNLKKWSLQVLPGRVMWTGFVPDEDLVRAYSSMNIVVYPSVYQSESGAMLMALGHGKAVVARNLGPTREKVGHGVVTFRKVKDLVKLIDKLLSDTELREKVEEEARRFSAENSWSNIAEEHIELFEKIVETSS